MIKCLTYINQDRLREIKPSVWRRLLVPDDLFLHDLHKVIQTAMGWENTHMHQYEKNGRTFGIGDEDYSNMPNFMDYTSIRLKDILKKRDDSFQYVYDLGDYWIHDVVLEDIHEPENTAIYQYVLMVKEIAHLSCGGPRDTNSAQGSKSSRTPRPRRVNGVVGL